MNRPITPGNRLRWLTWVLGLLAILFVLDRGLAAGGSGPRLPVAIAVVDLAIVVALFTRGLDVRMVLLLGALPLFAVTGGLPTMLVKIASEMANPATVVPICSAMGFAFVLRLTECDQHLVRLLLRPLAPAAPLLDSGRNRSQAT